MTTFNKENEVISPKKRSLKSKSIIVFIFGIVIASVGAYGTYKVSNWFDGHTLRFRLPVQNPIVVEERKPEIKTIEIIKEVKAYEETKAQSSLSSTGEINRLPSVPEGRADINSIVAKVYRLESSSGINDPCVRDRKGFNGYGFIPGTCYKTHAEVETLVKKWFEKNLKTHSLAESLCGYNLGFSSTDLKECINQSTQYPYYRNYLKY